LNKADHALLSVGNRSI